MNDRIGDRSTGSDAAGRVRLDLGDLSDEELRALRGALLAARATELSEVQRRAQRHNLGYGSDSQRESMTDEVADRRRRWDMLDRLLTALDRAMAKRRGD